MLVSEHNEMHQIINHYLIILYHFFISLILEENQNHVSSIM